MWKNFAWWKADRGRARADANDLVLEHGERAYDVACRMARAAKSGKLIEATKPRGHWDRVRREVRRIDRKRAQTSGTSPVR